MLYNIETILVQCLRWQFHGNEVNKKNIGVRIYFMRVGEPVLTFGQQNNTESQGLCNKHDYHKEIHGNNHARSFLIR